MRKIKCDTVTLPAYWASALVNGDESGLTDWEAARLAHSVANLESHGWYVVDVVRDDDGEPQEPRFTWSYGLYDPLADCSGGDVLDYIVHQVRP